MAMNKLSKVVDKVEDIGCVATLACMTVIIFGNAASRYLLYFSWSFTEELLMILFMWCTMFGVLVAYRRSQHLGLSAISDIAPPVLKIVFILISTAASVFLMIILITSGVELISAQITYKQVTPVMNIPEPLATLSIPLCSFIAVFRIVIKAIENIRLVLQTKEN